MQDIFLVVGAVIVFLILAYVVIGHMRKVNASKPKTFANDDVNDHRVMVTVLCGIVLLFWGFILTGNDTDLDKLIHVVQDLFGV